MNLQDSINTAIKPAPIPKLLSPASAQVIPDAASMVMAPAVTQLPAPIPEAQAPTDAINMVMSPDNIPALPSQNDAAQQNIVQQMVSDYPMLGQYNINYVDSIGKATGVDGAPATDRKLEYYQPTGVGRPGSSEGNPTKDRPTIELFDKTMTSKDAFGEMWSHYLPEVDPVFKKAREDFLKTITHDQYEDLYGDYQAQVKSGVFEPELGKTPPTFDQWIQRWGGDAFFRGYIAGQYPPESYNQQQILMFNNLLNYLKQGQQK